MPILCKKLQILLKKFSFCSIININFRDVIGKEVKMENDNKKREITETKNYVKNLIFCEKSLQFQKHCARIHSRTVLL